MAQPEGAPAAPPHWLIYIGTPDVDATVAEAQKLGGKVLKSPGDIPNVGRFAVLADPQGATFALFTPAGPPDDGVPPGGQVGDFTWHELATTDIDAALDFYIELFGWARGEAHNMGEMGVYQILSHGGQDVGGLWKVRDNSTPPGWTSYVRVADVEKATEDLKAAGGRVMHGPVDVPGGSRITVAFDPQGGAFALVRAPDDSRTDKVIAAVKKAATQVAETGKRAVEAVTSSVASVRKTAEKKAPARKSPARKAPPKKAPAKAPAPEKVVAKPAARSTAATREPAGKVQVKKAPAKKAPAKKTPAKKTAGSRTAAKKSAAAAKSTLKSAGRSGKGKASAKGRKVAGVKPVPKGRKGKVKGKPARKK